MAKGPVGRKLMESIMQQYLDSKGNKNPKVDAKCIVDFYNGTTELRWASGQKIGKEMMPFFEELLKKDGKLEGKVSAKDLVAYKGSVSGDVGSAIDSLGRYFEAAFVYQLEVVAHERGLEGTASTGADYDLYLGRLTDLGLTGDIDNINLIARMAAEEVLPDLCTQVVIEAIGGSSKLGDAGVTINGERVIFELKYLTNESKAAKWFTLSDKNFVETLMQAAFYSGDPNLWTFGGKYLPTDTWVANVRRFAVNEYARDIISGANAEAKDLLRFLIEKGGQITKEKENFSKKRVIRGYRASGAHHYEISMDLDTLMDKIEENNTISMSSDNVTLNFFMTSALSSSQKIANLTTDIDSVRRYSAEEIKNDSGKKKKNKSHPLESRRVPTEKETTSFLFYLQAGFFNA